jgi:hypothetical protein
MGGTSSEERYKKFSEFRRSRPLEELERKALKAQRKKGKLWTVEDIDCARAEAKQLFENLFDDGWEDPYDKQNIII